LTTPAAAPEEIGKLLDRLAAPDGAGWSGTYRLVGSGADLLLLHFRETLDELADVQLQLRRSLPGALLRLESDYTSVTETGPHQATADAAQQAVPGSAEYRGLLQEAAAAEQASAHMRTRLYPRPPDACDALHQLLPDVEAARTSGQLVRPADR
jgi:chlorite dismutase